MFEAQKNGLSSDIVGVIDHDNHQILLTSEEWIDGMRVTRHWYAGWLYYTGTTPIPQNTHPERLYFQVDQIYVDR